MSMNLSPRQITHMQVNFHRDTEAMVITTLLDRKALVWAEGRLCHHWWIVPLAWYYYAGLGHLSLRFMTMACPACGVISWPNYDVTETLLEDGGRVRRRSGN